METILEQFAVYNLDEQTVFLSLILLATVLVVFTLSLLLVGPKSPLKLKLEQLRQSTRSDKLKKSRRLDHTLESLAPVMKPSNSKESESIRQKLMHAGYHDANALTVFYAFKGMTVAVGLGLAAGFYFLTPDMAMLNLVMVASVGGGLYVPNILLGHLVKKRQSRIRGGIPDALDLMVVCTESGLGFNSALRRVADEVAISHPDFADELDTVCVKINAGVEMSDAFNDLIERTGLIEIAGLVTMLAHASRIGGSLAQTLREYTDDYRDKRNQEVEEIAAKIPTKMIFPLLLFIWPCFFIVAIGPSMLLFTSTLGN
ncbi:MULTISPECIES: type II secretion system F family protein [Vibrio]|uniref:type II secretion system F family protein n=1 Tax=Vibrio TaxID=662 RepID=UPI0001B94BF1|nr:MULTISPECIES: type II secretion system F family protein [Vibrio]EEX34198.1 flp pilus assembly protein TadC [Vibrio coralliilyticus ATCC BAA-450]MCM5509941.1 type II secretion system F family protein [Vibrio sp. SCSIO 43169]MDE3900795.1 type II secretion system F family protein [Vibrio sp. CC007]NRF15528.1 type II secretion system F family protein [Vibrio coralliilyticus]QFT35415.1 Bacterial type II secretion system protein F domain protein [Vibrio sp. THAF64]